MKPKIFLLLAVLATGASTLFLLPKSVPQARTAPAPQPTPSPAQATATPPRSFAHLAAASRTNALFRTPDLLWSEPVPEEPFARFKDWTERYLQATAAEKPAMVAEGVQLASLRRQALADLIRNDPERALQLTIPNSIRRALPTQVAGLLEQPVSARGDFAVLGVLAEPGDGTEVTSTIRKATIAGQTYDAFVYGNRLGEPTRRNIPLNGITLDGALAISENALRILEPAEAAEASARNQDAICSISQQPAAAANQQVVGDLGGQIVFFCHPEHALETNSRIVAAENGPPSPDGSGPDASTWTEGVKNMILIRVDFPDLVGTPVSDASSGSLITNMNSFYSEMSYGRTGFNPVGGGSDFTPTFRMPQPAAYYGTNNYYDQLRADARSAATAAGYTLANYNFDLICVGAVPGWSWSGLGYVGASGAWLRSSFSTGVAGHEVGHNYGLNHANYWDTGGASTIGAGTSVEYGDIFDTMGSASAGNNHFNARYKNYLNWLTTNDVVTATTNGVYRIMAHDNAGAYGVRGLKIVKNSQTNYWVELRQKFTSNKWLMSGAGLRWAQNSNQKSHLLDTTPGSVDGKNDACIVIGRTFSDKVSGIHITPIGKGGTTPETLDVVVNLGAFAGNQLPSLNLTSSATNAAVGGTLTFNASASDPDGDSLAYYWDFGDGNFGTNGPVAAKSWSSAGDYVVRCVVSDMKGGVASKSQVVVIGSPTTYRISGQITGPGGPLEGVRVYVSTTRMTFTDSSGGYMITGLPAGTYTVNASLEDFTFANSGTTNYLSVGPSQSGVNFDATLVTQSPPVITTQPSSLTVNPGTSATFSVVASGSTPLAYQWRFNGANISGAIGSSYTKSNVQATNAGNYSVVVSNAFGTATSANAALTVNSPPVISTPPQGQTVIGGNTATFTVIAGGTSPLAYQWRCNGTNLAGATSSSYSKPNAQTADAGAYTVIVTNSLGSVTSAPAALTINYTLTATAASGGTVAKSPDQMSYAPGTLVTLTATSTSSFPFSGWSGDASGSNNPLVLAVNTNLAITANFASLVPDLIVDNPQAAFTGTWSTDTSAADKYGADDRIASSVNSSATATATFMPAIALGGTYDLYIWFPTISKGATTVPWLISGNGTNFTVIVNQSSGSGGWQLLAAGVPFAPGTTGYVRVSNNTGQAAKNVAADAVRWSYSSNQIILPPVVTAPPQSQRVLQGGTAQFSVSASGSQPMVCLWRFNSQLINGATGDNFALTNALPAQAGLYDVVITNSAGSVTSAPASLVVSVRPTLKMPLAFSNGAPQLTITGTPGDLYTIQSSSNLTQWSDAASVSNQTGSILFTDPQAAGKALRFYRTRFGP